VDIAIAGPTGLVGGALLRVLAEKSPWLEREHGIRLTIVGAINRRKMTWDERGIGAESLVPRLAEDAPASWVAFAEHLQEHRAAPLVFLDCTASEFIARQYLGLLRAGVAIVTPNKLANTFEYAYYEQLRRLGRNGRTRYLYETTVGAATPMVRVLDDLRSTGDRIQRIEGVLSGTLSYVFSRINNGGTLSEAVGEAVQKGYTEPHPASDLSGEDVARKLLILAREAGYRLDRDDIRVEPLVPPALRSVTDTREYVRRLAEYDQTWRERAAAAQERGNRLTYLAQFDGTDAAVRAAELPAENPLVRLRPSENAVQYFTDRHTALPLTIQGIGAGPETTARGVLGDVIQMALEELKHDTIED
jgi:aspartokinase/homoserine dehydrogenase 1